MLNTLVASPQVSILQQALNASSLRHKVISNNIANVNTPGFKKSDVVFEDLLQNQLQTGTLPLARTNERHLPLQNGSVAKPVVNTINSTSFRTDGNNVDIDAEMAGLAKNNIYYNAVAQQLGRQFSNLKSVISEGRR